MEAILITVLGFLVVALGLGRVSDLRSKKKLKDAAVGALEEQKDVVDEERDQAVDAITDRLGDSRLLPLRSRIAWLKARARRYVAGRDDSSNGG